MPGMMSGGQVPISRLQVKRSTQWLSVALPKPATHDPALIGTRQRRAVPRLPSRRTRRTRKRHPRSRRPALADCRGRKTLRRRRLRTRECRRTDTVPSRPAARRPARELRACRALDLTGRAAVDGDAEVRGAALLAAGAGVEQRVASRRVLAAVVLCGVRRRLGAVGVDRRTFLLAGGSAGDVEAAVGRAAFVGRRAGVKERIAGGAGDRQSIRRAHPNWRPRLCSPSERPSSRGCDGRRLPAHRREPRRE